MKDVQKTIEILQHISTQLTANALNHQMMSRVFASQGFSKLAEKYAEHGASELDFIAQFHNRILDLDGELRQDAIPARQLFNDIEDFLAYDLKASQEGLPIVEEVLNAGYLDIITYDLIKDYYKDEEEDLNWTKSQIDLIQAVGKQVYLAKML